MVWYNMQMQAVILAAGRGSRMGELTDSTPKVMLEVSGKTLLEHKFDILPNDVDEIILVVGYFGSSIQSRFGGVYGDKKILYVEQEKLDGTAGALWRARSILKDQFLVMMGDDIYSQKDVIRGISKREGWTMGVAKRNPLGVGGRVILDAEDRITNIEEGMHEGEGFVGTNLFMLDTRIFDIDMVPKAEGSEEFGLPQTAVAASKKLSIPFYAIPATFWVQITTPEDVVRAEEILAQ